MAASFSAITRYPDPPFLSQGMKFFTIPWKHTVTRQTWTYVAGTFEHTFEHTMNDLRTEPQDVTLSQGGVGTTNLQIMRRWHPNVTHGYTVRRLFFREHKGRFNLARSMDEVARKTKIR